MHTRTRGSAVALAITVAALVLPAAASAGGWATVGLSSTPDGLRPGATWNAELTILQHGHTPLDDLHPTITITSGATSRTFSARPAGKPGTYRARVRFPQAGTWRYAIADGFTATHSYPPVQIGAASAAPGSEIAYDRLALALAAALAAAMAFVVPRRRRARRQPAVAGA